MDVIDTLKLLGITLPYYKLAACLYLQAAGKRFCMDFGYDNAVDLAREHWRNRKRL